MRIIKTNVVKTNTDASTIYINGGVNGSSSNNSAAQTSDYSQHSESASKLENAHLLWGQPFDGTQDVSGDITGAGNITATGSIQAESFNGETANIDEVNSTDVNSTNITSTNGSIHSLSGFESTFNNYFGDNAEFDYGEILELISQNITTENLTVTKSAHFFELIIDKIKAAGGAVLLTPADGFKVNKVVNVGNNKKLLFKASDGEKAISNMWKINDQAICQTFNNATVGTNYNVSNKYYWSLVIDVGTETINEEDYHYITLSSNIVDGTLNPEEGDEIAMLGYRGTDDTQRQSAIYIAAYNSIDTGLQAPLIAQYKGINDFNLPNHRYTYFAANDNAIRGNLLVSSGDNIENLLDTLRVVSTIHYWLATSMRTGVTYETSGWSTTVPETNGINKYLWHYIQTTYSDGSVEKTPPSIVGNYSSDGEDAVAVYVYSVNGNLTLFGDREVDLYAEVWMGSENITALLPNELFSWERVSDDSQTDETWNSVHTGYGKTIHLTDSDVYKKAVFNCVINVDSIKLYIQ